MSDADVALEAARRYQEDTISEQTKLVGLPHTARAKPDVDDQIRLS
jgi:hypothetical protein